MVGYVFLCVLLLAKYMHCSLLHYRSRAVFRIERQGAKLGFTEQKGSQALVCMYKYAVSQGVWGHAPLGNFGILELVRVNLLHS